MFRLEIELLLTFDPPMTDGVHGITLFQSFELPFPPTEGLNLTGNVFNPLGPTPEGFCLKEVTWDVDRRVFLAYISLSSLGLPMAHISDDLQMWLDVGWKFGSHEDRYQEPSDSQDQHDDQDEFADTFSAFSDDPIEQMPTLAPRLRPKEFNRLLRAMVRMMAETHNNDWVAFAMYRTQRYFSEDDLKTNNSKSAKAYAEAIEAFSQMSFSEREDWRDKVIKSYPRLDRIFSNTSNATKKR